MAYSTISIKKGMCVDCIDGKDKYLTAGRCQFHYKKHRNSVLKDRNDNRSDAKQILRIPLIKTATKDDLDAYFEYQVSLMYENPYCWECGAPIADLPPKNAAAHIFPKAIFDSVKTHPLNCLHVSALCGCHDKTHRLDTFSKMKVWPIAVERYLQFKHLITEQHKYLDLFKSYIVC